MNMLKWVTTICFMAGLVSGSWASPTLQFDGTGKLMGATGVEVNGSLYDVQFADGKCNDLFETCSQPTNFVFSSMAAADLASAALLNQVLLGDLDLNPTLTVGCSSQ